MLGATSCDMLILITLKASFLLFVTSCFPQYPSFPEDLICNASLDCVHPYHTIKELLLSWLCCSSATYLGCVGVVGCLLSLTLYMCLHSFITHVFFPRVSYLQSWGDPLWGLLLAGSTLRCHVWMLMLTYLPCEAVKYQQLSGHWSGCR